MCKSSKTLKHLVAATVLSVVTALFGNARAPAAAIVFQLPGSVQIIGGQLLVGVAISGMVTDAPPSLGTFDLDISYDTAVLAYVSTTFGDPVLGDQLDLTMQGSVTSATLGLGMVNIFGLSLDSPADLNALQRGDFVLATLTFQAVGAGTSNFGITVNALGDATGSAISNPQLGTGSVTVVPEPTALAILLACASIVLGRNRPNRRGVKAVGTF